MKSLILAITLIALNYLPYNLKAQTPRVLIYSGKCVCYSASRNYSNQWVAEKELEKGNARIVLSYVTNTATIFFNGRHICGGNCSSEINNKTGNEDFVWTTSDSTDQPQWFHASRSIDDHVFKVVIQGGYGDKMYILSDYNITSVP
jgi:hypothetical protein